MTTLIFLEDEKNDVNGEWSAEQWMLSLEKSMLKYMPQR